MTAEHADDNAVHERGYFWWSDTPIPENAFAPGGGSGGALKVSKNGQISLILDHVISGSPLDVFNQGQKIDRNLLGILRSDDRRVVLINPSRSGGEFKSSSFSRESFAAKYCLIGQRDVINWGGKELFYAMEIDLSEAGDLFSRSGVLLQRTETQTDISYKKPEDISFTLKDGSIELRFDLLVSGYGGRAPSRYLCKRARTSIAG